MRSTLPLLVVLGLVGVLVTASACHTIECGPGTIDRGGECEPADLTVGNAKCGPNTVLRGDQCVPEFSPTECDPDTTEPETDSNGVTKCIGTGGGGCSAPLACPDPADGKQTICGQIYNFVDDTPFAADGATGAQCSAIADRGPCSLKITVLDAITPKDLTSTVSSIYIDDCGRYRVSEIAPGGALAEALIFSEAGTPPSGTGTVTVPSILAFLPADLTAGKLRDFEAFVVDNAASTKWSDDGGPSLSVGIYAAIFRAHGCDPSTRKCNGDGDRLANQADVTLTSTLGNRYFVDGPSRRQIAPAAAKATTSNGAVLATLAAAPQISSVDGVGGLVEGCDWPGKSARPRPGAVLFSVFRPIDKVGEKCTQ